MSILETAVLLVLLMLLTWALSPVASSAFRVSILGLGTLTIVQNDVPPSEPVHLTLLATGLPMDLSATSGVTGVQATLVQETVSGPVPVGGWPRAGSIMAPATAGQVAVPWAAGDFATLGAYVLDMEVVYSGGVTVGTAEPLVIQVIALP